jgi:hypothetical protein
MIEYTKRLVLVNSVSDGRSRDRTVSIPYLSTRTKPFDEGVKLSITGREYGQ